ncbi:hypothetical protein V9K67_21550 [Paraflavisolibacter sp. H34]|uniref:hypothetical protein n=1 Tax=Huijunlia imazamoxiresistens TaxID=3127457 RepID=UPI003018EB4D
MEPIIDFTPVYQYSPHCTILGVQSFRTENHNWVEMDSGEAPEKQVLTAISQGATEICLRLKLPLSEEPELMQFDRNELVKDQWSHLKNRSMAAKLRRGEAIDVAGCPRTLEGFYILDDFMEGKDYCDAATEAWIWSVGISYRSGRIHASTGTSLYQNRDYECLFLR